MKKFLLLVLCVLSTLRLWAQDEQKSINVVVNSNEQVVAKCNVCDVSVMAIQSAKSDISLLIDVTNNDSSCDILLFGHAYPEKELKKRKPSIKFDKKSYGTTSRNIITCEGLNDDDVLQIEASESRTLTMKSEKKDIVTCVLPLYIAKTKNKKKYSIMSLVKITLNVRLIADKPNPDIYESIKQKYEEIIESIDNVTICTNKRHRSSAEQQKKPYKDKIDSLIYEINVIKDKYNLVEEDEIYKPYKEIVANLNKVEFKTNTCDKCKSNPNPNPNPVPNHHCKYCKMTSESVFKKMVSTYKQLDQGRIEKSVAVSSIKAIYDAYNGKCPNLTRNIERSGTHKEKINQYYNSIINY